VDVDAAVVADVAQLTKIVHKLANARPCGSNHLGKFLLSDGWNHALWLTWLAKLGHDQKRACETLFTIVEQLVNEVFPGPNPPE